MSNEHEQHRVIEANVFSHNRINRSVVVVAIVPVFAVVIFLFIAAWPYLSQIGLMLYWLAIICGTCIAALATFGAIYGCKLMREHYLAKKTQREIQSRMIAYGDVVAWIDDSGQIWHLSAQHEQAKLPSPRIVEGTEQKGGELSPEDAEVVDRSKVLTLYLEENVGMHKIADDLHIPYHKVRDWCNTAMKLRSQVGQIDQ